MQRRPLWREILWGGVWGAVAAILAILVYVVLATLIAWFGTSLHQGIPASEVMIEFIAEAPGQMLFGIGVLLLFALLPAILGGMALAGVIRYRAGKGTQIRYRGLWPGVAIGATATAVAAFVSLMTLLWSIRETPLLASVFVLPAIAMGAFAGGLVGRKLVKPYADGA